MKNQVCRAGLSLIAAAAVCSCVPVESQPGVQGPEPVSNLRVTAQSDASETFEGASVSLQAEATGGTPPYLFRWDFNGGPVEVGVADNVLANTDSEALSAPGLYVFRITVTDADDAHAIDFVSVTVVSAVTAEAPALAVVGEAVTLSASVAAEGALILWEVTEGTALLDDPQSLTPRLTTALDETVELSLTVTLPGSEGAPAVTRSFEVVSVSDLSPRVLLETSLGEITLELDGSAAPGHMVNFLLYVDDGFFDGVLFHRVVCTVGEDSETCEPFVIQAGGFERSGGEIIAREPTRDAVTSESDNGLSNGELYSVSMALVGGDPNSGTTQFFVNLDTDNTFLDDQSFTVFAQVVEGLDLVDQIANVETTESSVLGGEQSLPVEDVVLQRASRLIP